MPGTALAERPRCPSNPDGHGYMELRDPPGGWTREQRWCGTWYDCRSCRSSTLYPSPELLAQHAAMLARLDHHSRRRQP
jgi:hypothetical protein